MRTLALDDATAQRYSRVWRIVYILERWITAFAGLPMGIADEAISAPLPVYPDGNQQALVTEIQVKLCRILAQVVQSMCIEPYGGSHCALTCSSGLWC